MGSIALAHAAPCSEQPPQQPHARPHRRRGTWSAGRSAGTLAGGVQRQELIEKAGAKAKRRFFSNVSKREMTALALI